MEQMYIFRDGTKIELTDLEIHKAYEFKRAKELREKIDNEICGFYRDECWFRKYSKNNKFKEEVLEKAIKIAEEKLDLEFPSYSMHSAVVEAIANIDMEYKEKENEYEFYVKLGYTNGTIKVKETTSKEAYEAAMEIISNCLDKGFDGYDLDIDFNVEEKEIKYE